MLDRVEGTHMTDFTMRRVVAAPYDETQERVRELLGGVGFGILTEIDVRATLAEKLGVEVAPRVILGACRPQLAHRALEADPRIATMLPCNVVVSAVDEAHTEVEVLDPDTMADFSDAAEVTAVAGEARQLLAEVLATLEDEEPA
jgi:uncharacterized protein (DUF302 family)